MEPLDILAFSPHPDDAELGCGGNLIDAADKGLRVAVADLTLGERSSRGTPGRRDRERTAAAELLGLTARLTVGLPDTAIGRDPAHRDRIIEVIRETRPRIVLAPYWVDRHPDHAAAGKLVQEACFFSGVSKVGDGAPFRPRHLFFYMLHHSFTPSCVVDISHVWERKMAAVGAYESQFTAGGEGMPTAISQPGFIRFIEARAIYFGAMIGAAYGEPLLATGPLPFSETPGLDHSNWATDTLPPYSAGG